MSSGRTDSHVARDPEAARHHWTADRSLVHDPQAQLHMKGGAYHGGASRANASLGLR